MLTQNLWTQYGLVNGAIGSIVDICGADHVAETVIVNVPSYSGPSLCAPHPRTWIPVPRSSSQWYSRGSTKERKQFPLTLAYAITIHKSQGSTFPAGTKLVIDIGKQGVSILNTTTILLFCRVSGLGCGTDICSILEALCWMRYFSFWLSHF